MTPVTSWADLALLRESASLECKLAAGRDGKGALPDDFWPTYSAFANTDGGVVLLGVRERKGQFELTGIENPDKLRTDLFNQLNNRQKVSVNLLTDANVQELRMDGKVVRVVDVPRASRKQRPVHLTPNPLGGHTYRRLNEGDRPLPDEDVKRMLAEQVEDSRDARILPHFGLKDLDADSLKSYRNIFRADKPDHPWLALDDQGFLQMLGGWQQDRATGESGLTVAGLLMFGSWPSIAQALPMYFVDYQERPANYATTVQWLDRLVPDGTWSGNVFDFYRRVVSNPGALRVPAEQALQGGVSDCRNRTMQQMFLMIGLGERAGSGMSRIVHGWKDLGHGMRLSERYVPQEHTVLEMTWAATELATSHIPESSGESSGETGAEILLILKESPALTAAALAQRLKLTTRAVEKQFAKLKAQNRLRRVGANKGGHWEVLEPKP